MWRKLTLHARLSLLLSAILAVAVIAGLVGVIEASREHVLEEEQAISRLARVAIEASLPLVEQAPDPVKALDELVIRLQSDWQSVVSLRRNGVTTMPDHAHRPSGSTPKWFVDLILPDPKAEVIPVSLGGQHYADIVFIADLTSDFDEKWIAFISILFVGGGLVFALAALAYFTVRRSLRPLVELTDSLASLRRGNYAVRPIPKGPPEFAAVGQRLDELAATLTRLSEENRDLVRKIVAVQDVERRDIARELHDEMGPHLFAIRAGAMAIAGAGHDRAASGANDMLSSIKALQLVNRRILDRLRPMQLHEIGLEATLTSLIDGFRSTASKIAFRTQFDHGLSECDEAVAQTIYRVVQEGVVNALRHSRAGRIEVEVKLLENGVPSQGAPTDVMVRVSDNGVGIPAGVRFGRGLTGMKERLRALGGSLALRRGAVWTHVEATLPFRRRTHTVEESPEIVVLRG